MAAGIVANVYIRIRRVGMMAYRQFIRVCTQIDICLFIGTLKILFCQWCYAARNVKFATGV